MGTILSRIVFPESIKMGVSELYYHADAQVHEDDGGLYIPSCCTVRFDSYFNGFFYPKYLKYTHVTEISLHADIEGQAIVSANLLTKDGEQVLNGRHYYSGGIDLPPIEFALLPDGGMLYLTVQALDSEVCLRGGWYETAQEPVNATKVVAVICTYHREEYVKRNLAQLQQTVWENDECPIRDLLDLFVVDNGKTIDMVEQSHVSIFPNKNCGGSGGFTRGLIEAYRRRDTYTHVLFMDDDISFETETLIKTIQILRYARALERPLCIGGQMLSEDDPTTQFEAGALFKNGRAVPLNQGMDMTLPDVLLENSEEYRIQYNGWWFYCQPLSVVDKAGLPLPFFIKADDVEYCLRTNPYILLMNGIGVWHKQFGLKYSVHLEYYIKRNELVVSSLYDSGSGVCRSLWKLIKACGRSVLIGDTRAIDFIILAYVDFLKGLDFFLSVDGQVLHEKLLVESKRVPKNRLVAIIGAPFRLLPVMATFAVNYGRVREQYKKRSGELSSMSFWQSYLGL